MPETDANGWHSASTPPAFGIWCFVSDGKEIWYAVLDEYFGWTDQNCWTDSGKEVQWWQPIHDPPLPVADHPPTFYELTPGHVLHHATAVYAGSKRIWPVEEKD